MKFIISLLFSAMAHAQVNTSPNMNLPVPIPGVTPGPLWAQDIVAALTQIDSHNHSFGQGVQIQPNGLNISGDLTFQANNATNLRTARFSPQSSPIANTAPDVGAVYVSGNELYYNDVSGGHQVQLTSNGSINATSSGISSGTASASFSAGTLVVLSNVNTPANIEFGSAIMGNAASWPYFVTLQPPSSISNPGYTLTLPTIPASNSFMTLDTSGNMGAGISQTLGITNSMLFGNINTTKLFPGDQLNRLSVSKSADYTAVAANAVISYDTSGGAHTLTLYSAAASPGYTIVIIKTTSDYNALTISPAGGETINSASSTTINTQNESLTLIASGTNWVISNRVIPSVWQAATFQAALGITAIAGQSSFVRRVGDSLEVMFSSSNISVGANAAAIAMPSGLTVDLSKVTSSRSILGSYSQIANSSNSGFLYPGGATPSNSGVVFINSASNVNLLLSFQNINAANGPLNTFTANSFFASGNGLSATFKVPITGWN